MISVSNYRESHPDALPDPPRVLVIGANCSPDSMESHVVDALRNLACPVEFVATDTTFRSFGLTAQRVAARVLELCHREPERLAESRLLAAVDRFSPTLVLVILGSQLSPKTVALLRKRTLAPIVCWCQDQMTTLGRQYMLGCGYDAVFLKDRYLQDLFSRMIRSTAFFYLPEACNPRVHRSLDLSDADRERYGCDVMVAGSLYYYRQEILRQLTEFNLKIWGGTFGWMQDRLPGCHMNRIVVLDEKVRAARAARIALNPLHYAEIDGLNCRAFELAGCGAFQLVTSRPVLAEHFEPGVEVAAFGSAEELIAQVRHFLARPDEAAAIARRGQTRAHREHTYERRLQEIMRIVLGTNRP
jgi:spore maturation protein CgeB